jgi:hypothetical protein
VRRNEELEGRVDERTLQLAAARDQALLATRSKSVFLANVSHELRTPLNAIIGYAELLLDEMKDEGESRHAEDVEKIRVAARHQLRLINEVLDLSKIEAGKMDLTLTSVDVARLVADVSATVLPLSERNRNRFELKGADVPRYVRADETRLKQILLNLLSNAFKFTVDGLVTLEVFEEKSGSGEPFVVFRVTDDGIGIGESERERIFQPFSQASLGTAAKYGGTGLGLALSRRFCQTMGGDIELVSRPGKGSTFAVRLPAETAVPPGR